MNNDSKMWLIKKIVAQNFGLSVIQITERTRRLEVVKPRQIAHAIIYSLTDSSLKTIAAAFDMKNHTSIMHSIEVVNNRRDTEREYNNLYCLLKSKCSNALVVSYKFHQVKEAVK